MLIWINGRYARGKRHDCRSTLFFRAWWHFELMTYWGGLPYVDQVLDATQELNLPRLSYQECADKAAADFRRAADLLPIDWDKTSIGKATEGKNQLRVNKIMALGYLGKNYLWAGSPLMKNGAQLGGANAYNYDEEYCKKQHKHSVSYLLW